MVYQNSFGPHDEGSAGMFTIHCFIYNVYSIAIYCNYSTNTAVDWYNFIRDVCAQYFIDHPAIIGGQGVEDEIDESKFGRRKYNRGRYVDVHWVFGGTECITGESFLVEVEKRDAATLLPLTRSFIKTGSVIYSDEWWAYSRLQRIGYGHNTVNHSVNFVDPATGAHTQTVESMWSACKRMMREEKTMHSSLFDTYLPEFMWRRKSDSFRSDSFSNIITHISEQYPQ